MAKSSRKNGKGERESASYRVIDDVLSLATTLLRSRKDYAAAKLLTLAEATRDYAASMTDLPQLRTQVASISESMEGLADYVVHTDIEHMVQDAGLFARRQPVATLALAVAAGVFVSRMVRSPAQDAPVRQKSRTPRKAAKKSVIPRRKTNGSAQPHA